MKITKSQIEILKPLYIGFKENGYTTYSFCNSAMDNLLLTLHKTSLITVYDEVNYNKFIEYLKVSSVGYHKLTIENRGIIKYNNDQAEVERIENEIKKLSFKIEDKRKELNFIISTIKKIKFLKNKAK